MLKDYIEEKKDKKINSSQPTCQTLVKRLR
jgi:hypothetical protein